MKPEDLEKVMKDISLYAMEDGKPTAWMVGGRIFRFDGTVKEEKKEIKPKKRITRGPRSYRSGKFITRWGRSKIPIRSKVLSSMKRKENISIEQATNILKVFYPTTDINILRRRALAYLEYLKFLESKVETKVVKTERRGPGKVVGSWYHNNIRKNPLEEILEIYPCETSEIRKVLKKYHPQLKSSTLYTMASIYRSYINKNRWGDIADEEGQYFNRYKENVGYITINGQKRYIKKNIYDEFKKFIGDNKFHSFKEIREIVKKVNPNLNRSSQDSYVVYLLRFVRKKAVVSKTKKGKESFYFFSPKVVNINNTSGKGRAFFRKTH